MPLNATLAMALNGGKHGNNDEAAQVDNEANTEKEAEDSKAFGVAPPPPRQQQDIRNERSKASTVNGKEVDEFDDKAIVFNRPPLEGLFYFNLMHMICEIIELSIEFEIISRRNLTTFIWLVFWFFLLRLQLKI